MRLCSLAIPSLVILALGLPAQAVAGDAPAPVQVAETVTIETSDKPLETVLQWISRRAGVNVVCYEQDQPRVTVRLANVTWQEAVDSIAAKYDLVVEKKSPRVWVLTRPPKVSMSFQDASLPVVLEAIARAADVNIIMSGEVASGGKRLSMTLRGVPWRYALDVVVKTVDLAWVEQEYNIIRIVSRDSLQKDLKTKVVDVSYRDAKSFGEKLKAVLKDVSVDVVDGSNSLILTGTPPALESAQRLIDQLDQRTRQVLIEMKFVDFSTTDVQGLGFDPINLNFDIENLGNVRQAFTPFGTAATTSTVINRIGAGPTSSRLNTAGLTFEAIASLNSTDILQSPQILTVDGQEAKINIGREIRFAESQQTTNDNGPPTTTLKEAASSPVKDGINVLVTPTITADGFVRIKLLATNDEAELRRYTSGEGLNAASIELPNKNTTSVENTIMVADGRTAVIGGLLKDKDQKQNGHVPGLGSLPVLGFFFRKERQTVEKRNLTIFITPRIIPMGRKTEFDKSLDELKASLSGIREEKPKSEQVDGQPATLAE